MSERREQLEFAIAAAFEAGRITLGHFQTGVTSEYKEDLSPVTIADREAEERLRELIADRYPDHGIVGEEFGEANSGASRRWFLDPIDGTRSFVRGVPLYGVLLALEVDGRIEVGVAHFPALGETVWAARGEGCFWNGRRCRVRATTALSEAAIGFTNAGSFARHGRDAAWSRLLATGAYAVGWSDAYGHALVASGRLDVMLDPIMNPWDCGPFPVLLAEAGGFFGSWTGEETIDAGEAISVTGALKDELLTIVGD